MKFKSITITGMHKVDKKTYTFNDDVTYFIGENGSGKSTILEAAELALLGYIPGYAKTNESIMKHASGPAMSIEAEFDNGIKITRTWIRSGASVKSTADISGYEGEISELLGDVELPVFDFNEFRSMTANKLKDWFISFLPSSSDELDVQTILSDAVSDRAIPSTELVDEAVEWADNSGLQGIELVRGLNNYFKESQSFVKGQIAKLEGTIQSLVKYDDAEDLDEESVSTSMKELQTLKTSLIQYNASKDVYDRSKAEVNKLKAMLPAEKLNDDPRIADLKSKIEEYTKKNNVLKSDYADLQNEISQLEQKKMMLGKAGTSCPYTGEHCDTAAKLADKIKAEAAEIDKQIAFKKEEMQDCDRSKQSENDREIMKLNAELGSIQAAYDKFVAMQMQLENAIVSEPPTDETLADLDAKLATMQNQLVKIAANKKYEELSDTVTKDKFKLENDLEIYKIWTKLTDANGLQTELMNKPFENLASEMSDYLTKMFNQDTTAEFNLSSKANSFSFGMRRGDQYIEFDYLSSGERCLFTLALIMCILDKSSSSARVILIDDILDHLDSTNASYLFNILKQVSDIQFILAGVKECEDIAICKPVV